MVTCLILSSVAFMAGAVAAGLLVVVIGIHRSDHGKHLTGWPASNSEAFARRLLTGSRGYGPGDNTGEG
jgi:hypothetical protein